MNWIDVEKDHPKSPWEYVLVTDGNVVTLATWKEKPSEWYSEEELVEIGDEWRESHWVFELAETGIGPFNEGQECFASIEGVSHWMPLPEVPK